MFLAELLEGSRISRVLIANRGEIVSRIIRTCKALGITCIAIYTHQDKDAQFWQSADVQHYAGDIEVDGNPYMDAQKLVAIARQYQADAIHPGYGFLSENAAFARAVLESGMIWVGPHHETIALLGDKAACKKFLLEHSHGKVPLVPGSNAKDVKAAIQAANEIGYPILLKAAAGGGGRGMRVVRSDSEMQHNLDTARSEAMRLFGSDELLLEKYLPSCKHVEVQIIGDGQGQCLLFGDRDCSVQRRHQKVIEECPAMISQRLKDVLYEAARTIAKITNYFNAATVEFLVDVVNEKAYFLEVNTRIQVEHPVTEQVFNVDLIALQFFVASQGQLSSLPRFDPVGHSIQLRLYAEDPYQDYLPQSGLITYFSTRNTDARCESAVCTGQKVSFSFDPLITKIIVTGSRRREAIKRAAAAAQKVICLGLQTNQLFLQQCLAMASFQDATYDTSFINKNITRLLSKPRADDPIAVASASAIARCIRSQPMKPGRLPRFSEELISVSQDSQFMVRQVSSSSSSSQKQYSLEMRNVAKAREQIPKSALNKEGYRYVTGLYDTKASPMIATVAVSINNVKTSKLAHGSFILTDLVINGRQTLHAATIHQISDGVNIIHIDGLGTYHRRSALVGFGSLDYRQAGTGSGVTDYKSPMPGRVIRIDSATGSTVQIGDCILVLESMKTEVRILAHSAGTVEVMVKSGDVVDSGSILAIVAVSKD